MEKLCILSLKKLEALLAALALFAAVLGDEGGTVV